MFNSKDIQKELESNHEIVLLDSSIITKLKDMGYSYSAQTQSLKLPKAQMEAWEKWAKESSLVNRSKCNLYRWNSILRKRCYS